jgi:hypothetical protein
MAAQDQAEGDARAGAAQTTPPPCTPQQQHLLRRWLQRTGRREEEILRHYRLTRLEELPALTARAAQGRFRPHTSEYERETTVAEAKWCGAPFLLVTASWFVDYTMLAVAVLLCATIWLLLHMAGVTVRGSFRLVRGRRPSMGRLRASVTRGRRAPHLHG